MNLSREAIMGIFFVAFLFVAAIYVRNHKPKVVFSGDENSQEIIDSLYKANKQSLDSIYSLNVLLEASHNREKELTLIESKIKYIYVKERIDFVNATISGKDSILRADLGIGR